MCITNPMKPIDTYAELVDSYGTEYEHYHSKQIQGKQLHMKCCGETRLTVLDSRGSIQFTYTSTTNSCNRSLQEKEKPVNHQPPHPPPPPPEPPKRPLVFPIYHGKSLVTEIIEIRKAYLQNGGNDPDLLNNMAHMQTKAKTIEDQNPQQRFPREKPKDNATTLNFLEMENDRLNQELRLLQEQNLLAQNSKKSDKEDELEREFTRLRREHLEKMYGLQKELDDLRILLMMQRNMPHAPHAPPQTVIQQAAPPPVSLKHYLEVEPTSPYDQNAGFLIFYDFILSLDPTIQACRLVVGLHSSSAVIGEPTVLPTVYTEPATRGERFNYSYSNAVFGANQPVPKCPPEPDLGIVVELQASGGPASEHDRHSLITRAWTKIPLFDNNGRLIAGRIRIRMRNVPIKPFLHVSYVQRVAQYGDADLYYRTANMRDAEIHSMQQISAANCNQYTHLQFEARDIKIPVYSPKQNISHSPTATPPMPKPRTQRRGRLFCCDTHLVINPESHSLASIGLKTAQPSSPTPQKLRQGNNEVGGRRVRRGERNEHLQFNKRNYQEPGLINLHNQSQD